MSENFLEDDKLQKIAEAYALDAVDFARNFKLSLDWADTSVAKVESILDILHRERARARPSEEQVWGFAKMFGSYVGEVFRKNHGATWGMITINDESFPGLKTSTTQLFWPWSRVHNRLSRGESENVWHYYKVLTEKSSK